MDVEYTKDKVLVALRDLEDEARILIDRIAKARCDLGRVKTEADLCAYADDCDLEAGLKYISLIAR